MSEESPRRSRRTRRRIGRAAPMKLDRGFSVISVASVVNAALALALVFATAAHADPVEDFYRGKIVTMLVGTGENGGAIEAYPRNLAEVIAPYIPGHPTLIVRNMPGGAGVTAANYIY